MEIVPGVHHAGNVGPKAVWAGQRAAEVQVSGAESSNGPVRTTTEDQVLRDGQTGGLRHLEADAALGQRSPTKTRRLGVKNVDGRMDGRTDG